MDPRPPGARARSDLVWGSAAPAAARREAADFAARLGAAPEVLRGLLLVVSELVTNAVQHGGPPLTLLLERQAGVIRVEVSDGGAAEPRLRAGREQASARGRGLEIVSALAGTWGWRPDGTGKTVWCEVRLAG